MLRRRSFLGFGLGAATLSLANPAVWALDTGHEANGRLIVLFLRGGLDGLFAFSPVGDPRLSELRPTLSATVLAKGIPLGNTGFAAHPAAHLLADLFAVGELSFAAAAGTTDTSRSHFQAQDLFELGTGKTRGSSGFLARAADALGGRYAPISFTRGIPLALQGAEVPPRVAPLTGSGLKLPEGALGEAIRNAHRGRPSGEALDLAGTTQAQITEAMNMAVGTSTAMDAEAGRGANSAGGFARTAALMGRLLRHNPRLPLAFVDLGGMDTHAGEEGSLSRTLPEIGAGLIALKDALGELEWRRTQVAVMSEFGRTVRENGTRGTDHGHGGLFMLAGGAINGRRLLGDFAGLQDEALNEKRDLPALLDWRDLLALCLADTCGFNAVTLNAVFPGRPQQISRL